MNKTGEIEMTIYIIYFSLFHVSHLWLLYMNRGTTMEVEMTILKIVHHESSAMLLNIYIIGGTTSVGLQQLFIMSHLHCYLTCI